MISPRSSPRDPKCPQGDGHICDAQNYLLGRYRPAVIWEAQPRDNHLWAFLYFCRKQGDIVKVKNRADGLVDLYVWRWDG